MQLHKHLLKSVFGKAALATAALGGFFLLAGAPSAKANDWDDCNRRAAFADVRLQDSVIRFGYYSPQAGYWRHERQEAYEQRERFRYERERERREHEWREHERWEHHHDRDWDR